MTSEQVRSLLEAEESDRLERKASLSDADAIRDTFIQFANDLADRGGGLLIIGQGPDKRVVGLKIGDDEAQRRLADIARNRCRPAIPIIAEIHSLDDNAHIAIVDVRASAARPHFGGNCYVRIGSTKRIATDAEIMALRYTKGNPKIAELQSWLAENKRTLTTIQMPKDERGSVYAGMLTLVDVRPNYIVLQSSNESPPVTLPINDLETGWDFKNDRPQIFFRIRKLV